VSHRPVRGALAPLLVLFGACAPAVQLTPVPTGATTALITADDMRHRVEILAHDSMRGRDTGTRGIRMAAEYLVAELSRLGLRPAGDDGTFFNHSPLQRRIRDLEVTLTSGGATTQPGLDEVVSVAGLAGLPATGRTEGSGPVVFAGHLLDPDITRELTAQELAGAVVIVRLAPPEGVNPQQTPPRLPLAMLFGPGSPAAAVLLVAEEGEAELWSFVSAIARRGQVEIQGESPPAGPAPAFFMVTPDFVERATAAPLAGAREPRTGLGTFTYSMRERVEPIEAWNIAAVLPGRDAARAGQYVSLGAHYDHVGIGVPVNGDSIYNGADDNASGTAAVLEVAERLASLPQRDRPARSVLFLWYTGEEHGLLGSRTFADAPTVPRDSIVVNINADMVGRNHPDSLHVVGAGRFSSTLEAAVERINRALPRSFIFDRTYDQPGHPERIFCRSDHYNFARHRIPIVFFTTGLHEDYHQPSDTVEKLDYDKASRVAHLMAALTRDLADAPQRPQIDRTVEEALAECAGM
jgi:hypothetical protein